MGFFFEPLLKQSKMLGQDLLHEVGVLSSEP